MDLKTFFLVSVAVLPFGLEASNLPKMHCYVLVVRVTVAPIATTQMSAVRPTTKRVLQVSESRERMVLVQQNFEQALRISDLAKEHYFEPLQILEFYPMYFQKLSAFAQHPFEQKWQSGQNFGPLQPLPSLLPLSLAKKKFALHQVLWMYDFESLYLRHTLGLYQNRLAIHY